jgi:hypothetical protein
MNQVIAAAESLGISAISYYEVPHQDNQATWAAFDVFETAVVNLTIQIQINHARRRRAYSVELDASEKVKIRHYIGQIKIIVEESNISEDKRDMILKKLSELTLEIDRNRTRFEIIADAARGFARLSGEVERQGAEPWWKWVKLIFGVIDDAKEREPRISLPAPVEQKRIEAPRKNPASLSNASNDLDSDDDIPF